MTERPRVLDQLGSELDRIAQQRLDGTESVRRRSVVQSLVFAMAAIVALAVVIGVALISHRAHASGVAGWSVSTPRQSGQPAPTVSSPQQPSPPPIDRSRLLKRVESLRIQPDPELLRHFAVFGVTSRRGVTIKGLTISHPTIASLPTQILEGLTGEAEDPRQIRQATTKSGRTLWVVPGPRTLCVLTLSGGSCAGSVSSALQEGVVLEGSSDGVNWHYAAFPDSRTTATVSTGPHTRSSFPLIKGVFIYGDVPVLGTSSGPPRPKPTPPTALSRAAEKNPATPNLVTATPATGGPHSTFAIAFRILLSRGLYQYVVSGPGGRDCTSQIHYGGGGGFTGGSYDIRGQRVSEPFAPGTNNAPRGMKAWCPGTYHVAVSALIPGRQTKYSSPFGTATFTIR